MFGTSGRRKHLVALNKKELHNNGADTTGRKKKTQNEILKQAVYSISGKRILDPTISLITQGLSPSSSATIAKPRIWTKKKKSLLSTQSPPSTPLTIIGYSEGYPRGLYITKNSSPQPLVIAAPKNFTSRKHIVHSVQTQGIEVVRPTLRAELLAKKEGNNAGIEKADIVDESELSRVPVKSRTAESVPHQQHQRLREMTSHTSMSTKARQNLVAPWRGISAFQSPNERRRKTFNSFKMMSPDPPRSPMHIGSRHGLNDSVTHSVTTSSMIQRRHHERKFYDRYESSLSISSRKKPSHNLSFMITSPVTAPLVKGSSSKRKRATTAGKSTIGLSTSSRLDDMIHVRKTPSHTITGRFGKTSIHDSRFQHKNLFRPGTATTGSTSSRTSNTQTSQVSASTSKRLDLTRNINPVLSTPTNALIVTSARVEAREKSANLVPATTQRTTVEMQPVKISPPNVSNTETMQVTLPAPVVSNNNSAARQKLIKPQLMPPVHVPGPKRENIYIGHYDGSDADSDTDQEQSKELSNPVATTKNSKIRQSVLMK